MSDKRLAKGETVKMTGKMLVGLSRLSQDSFMTKVGDILYQEVSLKTVALGGSKEPRRRNSNLDSSGLTPS